MSLRTLLITQILCGLPMAGKQPSSATGPTMMRNWRMSADGTDLVNLTTSPNSHDLQPAWQQSLQSRPGRILIEYPWPYLPPTFVTAPTW